MFPLHLNRLNRKFSLNGKRSAPRVEKGSDNHDNDDHDDEDDDDDAAADDDDYDSYVLLTIAEK